MSNRILSLIVLLTTLLASQQGLSATLDRIAAVVDDDIILVSELERETDLLRQQLQQSNNPMPPDNVLREGALERLILQKLQLAAAKRLGIEADQETLSAAINNIASRNRLTIPQLRAALAQDGIDYAEFQEKLRKDIVLSRLRNTEVLNRIQVSDAEIDAYLAQASASEGGRSDVYLLHILVALSENASAEDKAAAMDKAEKLLARIRAGEDFRALAEQESEGRQAEKGGDLGWMRVDQVPTLFASAVKTLKKGEVAGPLSSGSGLHLIQLEDYKGEDRQLIPQTHVRHILVKTNELTSDTDALERLAKIRDRLENGEDFATLARSHSDDTGSAIKGGDLGWANPGDMVPEFEAMMARLPKGQLSKPFRTQFGWHILEVLDRREHDATEEVRRREALKELRNRKAQVAGEEYLRRLRDEAYVEIRVREN